MKIIFHQPVQAVQAFEFTGYLTWEEVAEVVERERTVALVRPVRIGATKELHNRFPGLPLGEAIRIVDAYELHRVCPGTQTSP